jgi:hypothetical protein
MMVFVTVRMGRVHGGDNRGMVPMMGTIIIFMIIIITTTTSSLMTGSDEGITASGGGREIDKLGIEALEQFVEF